MAVSRNVFFEIKYSSTISDSNERRATISKAQQYHMVGKSKHIMLTSGAENKFQIRSPYDVSNLGLIFGLSEEQSKNSVLALGRKLLQSAGIHHYYYII